MAKNSDTYGIFDAYRNVLIKEAVKPTEQEGLYKTKEEIENAKLRASTITNKPMREKMEKVIADSERALQGSQSAQATPAQTTTAATSESKPSMFSSIGGFSEPIIPQSPSQGTNISNQSQVSTLGTNKDSQPTAQVSSNTSTDVSSSATNPSAKKYSPPKIRGDAAAMRDRGELQKAPKAPDLEAEYNKKLGRTPGRFDPDNFSNVDRPGNKERFKDMADYKNQLQSGKVSPTTEQPSASTSTPSATTPQTTPTSATDDFQKKLDAQFADFQKGNTTQSANQTDDFQKKLDAQFADFQKGNTTQSAQAASQPAQQATQPKTQSSDGGSIVNYLASKGQASDKGSRAKLAAQYGIQGYSGTAEQNTQLLNKLKANEKMPQGTNSTGEQQYASGTVPKATLPQKKGMGGIVGGASKAVGSVGQGIKQATIGNKKPLGGILGGISKGLGTLGKGVKTALVGNQEEEEEGWVEQGEPEVENVSDEYDTEETPTQYKESVAIAKFLRCLSEKNYHQANIHLNDIVQNKVKKKISNSIK